MDQPSRKEIYEMIRGQVEHEDHLIDQRVNWFLIVQGFLFVAYTTLIVVKDPPKQAHLAIWVISASAILLNISSLVGIGAAFLHIEKLRLFWKNLSPSPEEDKFPPIMGTGKLLRGGTGSVAIPIILIIAWLVMLLLTMPGSPV